MKKNKYLPFYVFVGLMCLGALSQKLIGHRGIGNLLPEEPSTWPEIIKNLPWSVSVCIIFTFVIIRIVKEIRVMAEKNLVKKRKIEQEKVYSASNTHECRVCGCCFEDFPWGEDGKSPSFQICPCCGVQFGKEDRTLESIKTYRAEWKNSGGKWFMENERPECWDIEQQMKNIPDDFK